MKVSNKYKHTAMVTGAGAGLGYEFSMLLAKDHYDLILIDIDIKKLKALKDEISKNYSVKVDLIKKDLAEPNAAIELFEKIKRPIDVLINNAGFGLFGQFAKTSWLRESSMINLHVVTTTHLTKIVLNGMVDRHSGRIMNVSSMAAFQPGPLMSIYYASKAYILSFSEAIANELKGTGVTVTALCPGPTRTNFQQVVSNSSSKNSIKVNMACAKQVAQYGYDAMQKGKTIAIPGPINRLLSNLPRILSRNMVTSIVRWIQEKNRSKQLRLINP